MKAINSCMDLTPVVLVQGYLDYILLTELVFSFPQAMNVVKT